MPMPTRLAHNAAPVARQGRTSAAAAAWYIASVYRFAGSDVTVFPEPPAATWRSAGSGRLCQLSQYRVAHLAGRGAGRARLQDVAGARAGGERPAHRILDQGRLVAEVERIAQHHREGEDAGER